MTKKLERLAHRAIIQGGARLIERLPVSGHGRYVIELPSGTRHTITVSSSPTILDNTIRAVIRDVKRLVAQDSPPTTTTPSEAL